ncbi:flagellar basal body P-ring protein FlgI [Hippea maritima]|uniref:Flagellar P-ring protein n=1 Tax=Hippea maritima (strain ATCC 700847 / DSM 10411 / MH2) TaxID=760142 RepID=F2LY26_HIPMA|nr:flagellar basal body P-ring protein FlgI [Hippea maritima]AEA33291.1 Flagellar P-ring protein [Hippea maritima DSM 10411]
MRKVLTVLFILFLSINTFAFDVKIRDLTSVVGVRYNQLVGYGIVVGLAGTGDGTSSKFTIQSIVNALKRFGVTLSQSEIGSLQTKNIAAVMVTAQLPPFAKQGERIDVTVSSIGDAKSLQGGTLIMTPLKGPDGNVYAVAQGPISIGGYNAGMGGGTKVRKNHPTVGRIPNGAIVENQVNVDINSKQSFILALNQPSFEMATRIANTINKFYRRQMAFPSDGGSIKVIVPPLYRGAVVELISQINQLSVDQITEPRVVLDEKTGTVVVGGDVTIEPISISHGNLTITVTSTKEVSQPNPLAKGKTTTVTNKQVSVNEGKGKFLTFSKGATVSELIQALNKAGATPRDMMAIFQAIKAAGALNAKLEMM